MAGYPEDCIQYLVDPWWTVDARPNLCAGRLVRAYIPHIEQEALVLHADGRTSPGGHASVDLRVGALDAKSPPSPAANKAAPAAALPHYAGEVYMVQRAKLRPAIVVSVEPPRGALPQGIPPWQALQTVYVAPVYGCDQGGWDKTFMERIKACMYPQYMLDRLPLPGPEWSVVRFDQVQPISRNTQSLLLTEHCLSQEAIAVVRDWLTWIQTGEVAADGALDIYQTEIKDRVVKSQHRLL